MLGACKHTVRIYLLFGTNPPAAGDQALRVKALNSVPIKVLWRNLSPSKCDLVMGSIRR